MKSSDAVRQLRAELMQDYDFIVTDAEKNAIMTARIARSQDRDEFIKARSFPQRWNSPTRQPTIWQQTSRSIMNGSWASCRA